MQDVYELMTRRQKREQKKQEAKKEMWSWIREIVVVVVAVLLIKTFLFEIITVEGDSMLETLRTGDRMYVSILSARIEGYQRGDIVICYYPNRTDRCVKRIIALPGDSVEIIQGTVYVNGELVEEDYIDHQGRYTYPLTVMGEGEYFVLGDNRPISHDSHSNDVGPVTRIEGKARFIIWPLDRIGKAE